MTKFLTILTSASGIPTAKKFILGADDTIQKLPPRMSRFFTCERMKFTDIFGLHLFLRELENDPYSFVIRGEPVNESTDGTRPVRRTKYADGDQSADFRSAESGISWLCFDFDKIACPNHINPSNDPETSIRYLRDLLPASFQQTTCSWQWSNSAGMDGWKTLSAHLWFVVSNPLDDDSLRQWARELSLPVDLSLFNTVQPHFTAKPIFENVSDPAQQRSGILCGSQDSATINLGQHNESGLTQAMRGSSLRRGLAESTGSRSQGFRSARPILVDRGPHDPSKVPRRVTTASYRTPKTH